jgi:hypothetical protein
MLILQVVTRLADLGDKSAQLEDNISASSHLLFSRHSVSSACALVTTSRRAPTPGLPPYDRLFSSDSIWHHDSTCLSYTRPADLRDISAQL